jgi:hypothetical protein
MSAPRMAFALLGTLATLAAPAAAVAKGGGGGGGTPQPAPGATPCATLASDRPGEILSNGGATPIGLGWVVTNCASAPETVSVSVVPTGIRLVGSTVVTCTGQRFSAGAVTLKAGETRTLKVDAPPDACHPAGTAMNVNFDATATSAGGGVLATALHIVTVRTRA